MVDSEPREQQNTEEKPSQGLFQRLLRRRQKKEDQTPPAQDQETSPESQKLENLGIPQAPIKKTEHHQQMKLPNNLEISVAFGQEIQDKGDIEFAIKELGKSITEVASINIQDFTTSPDLVENIADVEKDIEALFATLEALTKLGATPDSLRQMLNKLVEQRQHDAQRTIQNIKSANPDISEEELKKKSAWSLSKFRSQSQPNQEPKLNSEESFQKENKAFWTVDMRSDKRVLIRDTGTKVLLEFDELFSESGYRERPVVLPKEHFDWDPNQGSQPLPTEKIRPLFDAAIAFSRLGCQDYKTRGYIETAIESRRL